MQEKPESKKKAIYWKQVLRSIYSLYIIYIVYMCFYNMSIYVRDLCVEVEPNVSHVWQLFSNFGPASGSNKEPSRLSPFICNLGSTIPSKKFLRRQWMCRGRYINLIHLTDSLGPCDSWIHRSLLSSFGSSTCNQFKMERRFFVEKSHGILSNTKQTYTLTSVPALLGGGSSWIFMATVGQLHEMRAQKRTQHKEMDRD